jgi:hypothetical protein
MLPGATVYGFCMEPVKIDRASGASPREAPERPVRSRRPLAWAAGAGVVCLLYLAYHGQAASYGSDADGASNVLQAWDMLHGNLLLHGWWLTDVSFYTTELPEYMIVELIRGMNATVEPVAAAVTYTLMVLLAVVVAKGKATGAEGLTRALIAGGIMLAPWGPDGGGQLLSVPNHAGTTVPLLVIWLVIDRLGDRWYLPWLVGGLLTWVEIADQIAVFVAAVPLVIVSVIRLAQRRESRRLDAGLLVAGPASVVAAEGITLLIHRAGGYFVYAFHPAFAKIGEVPDRLKWAADSVLALFGASFAGAPLGPGTAVSALHLVGMILAGWAFCIGARRLLRAEDRLVPLLVVGITVLLAGYVFADKAAGLASSHEVAPVLACGAVLAGRLLPGRRVVTALTPVLAVALVAYAGVLGYSATRPPAPPVNAVQSWLTSRKLATGLADDYWIANGTTVNTSGRVSVRVVSLSCGRFIPFAWNTKKQWYEPPNTANFLVISLPEGSTGTTTAGAATAQFGAPRLTARIGSDEVLVWNHNVLPAVSSRWPRRCGSPWVS